MFRLLSTIAQAGAVPGADVFIKTVDQAEKASDRWLFLAAVILILVFAFSVIKFLIKDRESTRTEHSSQLKEAYLQVEVARKEYVATLKEMYLENTRLTAQLLVAMQENNALISRVDKLISQITEK